jgi:hypothetical protein
MTLRDDLCALRDRTDQIERDLAAIEARLASDDTASLIRSAQCTTRATFDLISRALRQPLVEAAADIAAPAGAGL